MNSAEKLQWARLLTVAGLLLIAGLLLVVADSISTYWFADLERELTSSLEIVSSSLVGK